jgi:hypothetical protein
MICFGIGSALKVLINVQQSPRNIYQCQVILGSRREVENAHLSADG